MKGWRDLALQDVGTMKKNKQQRLIGDKWRSLEKGASPVAESYAIGFTPHALVDVQVGIRRVVGRPLYAGSVRPQNELQNGGAEKAQSGNQENGF